MTLLTLMITFMDISGLPAVLFVNVSFYDVTPYIFCLFINFILIGLLAGLAMKIFGKDWPLGLRIREVGNGLKKYAIPGLLAGVASFFAFYVGLKPFDYQPTMWKIIIEGILYYLGVAMVEELYVRGLFLNIIDKIAYKKKNHAELAIWISSIVFGLGHIPGMLGLGGMVILFKLISTIGMGLYFGTIYKKTNNLWVPIILHAIIDICALPYCFTTFSGYKKRSLFWLLLIFFALGIYSVYIMKKKNDGADRKSTCAAKKTWKK